MNSQASNQSQDQKGSIEEIYRQAEFPIPIVQVDFSGRISYVNPAAKAKFPDIQKITLRHPFFGDWLGVVNILKGKSKSTFTREIRIGDHWYFQQFYVVPNTGIIRIYSINIDIQKNAQEALAKKQEELETILNSSPRIWIFYKDTKNCFLRVNKAFAQVMGMPRERLEGRCLSDIYPKAEAESYWKDDQEVIDSGKPKVGIIETMESKQGQLWVETDKIPYRDNEGNIIGVIGFTIDITDRKNAEEDVRKQADLIDLSPDAIIVRKLDGKITFWSSGAEKMYGWTKQEAIGQEMQALLRTQSKKPFIEIFEELKHNMNWSGELTHYTKDGLAVIVQSYWLARFDSECNLDEIYESNIDVTERNRLQQKIEENATLVEEYANQMEQLANQRLEQLKVSERLAAIGQTAGMVGHDIRNPLQAITGDLYLIEQTLNSTPSCNSKDIAESINAINENIGYINKIVSDLQDYTRGLKPAVSVVDIQQVIKSSLVGKPLPGIDLQIETLNNFTLKTDATYLRRIIANLVNNAAQAMPKGGKITIKAYEDKNKAKLIIQDTGVGIREEDKPNLFKPLFTTKAKGQGLGLAVVKRLVETLNGTITFESQEGKGTKFIIELPMAPSI